MSGNILIVDDEKNIREGLKKAIDMDGYNSFVAENGEQALSIIETMHIDLVITDLKMPIMSGEKLLKKIRTNHSNLPVIILTGHGTIDNAVKAMQDGAYDYFTKPPNLDKLTIIINRALKKKQIELENQLLKDRIDDKYKFENIIGTSAIMQNIFKKIRQIAPTKTTILLTGESGTGKELIANAIHNLSDKKEGPFVKVHCAALNENLLESELFGHEKGSFTGALARKKGRFELANGGTIFLDEIGDISPLVQVKLLRVLQERQFERVGGEQTLTVDVRVITATNKDLLEEVKKNNFREDLYYRLNVVNVHLPALKERKSDIPLLVNAFIKEFSQENNLHNISVSAKAMTIIENYNWPGNVRELRNVLEGAVVLCKNNTITENDLPISINYEKNNSGIFIPYGLTMSEIEKLVIKQTLAYTQGNKSQAAKILDIGRKTLHRKLSENGKLSEND